jgi:DNA-binding MarR family transcriptional regulator
LESELRGIGGSTRNNPDWLPKFATDSKAHAVERHLDRSAFALIRFALEIDMLAEQVASIYDVSGRDVRAIAHVAFAGPLSATRLADRLQVSRGAMTGILRRLQLGGWLTVESDPDDGRRLIVGRSERTEGLLCRWLGALTSELRGEHPSAPHPSFPHDMVAVSTVVERHRALLQSLGPAELRALGQVADVPLRTSRP